MGRDETEPTANKELKDLRTDSPGMSDSGTSVTTHILNTCTSVSTTNPPVGSTMGQLTSSNHQHVRTSNKKK